MCEKMPIEGAIHLQSHSIPLTESLMRISSYLLKIHVLQQIQGSLEPDQDLYLFVQLLQVQISYLDPGTSHDDVQMVKNGVLDKASTSQGWQVCWTRGTECY